MEKLLKFTCIVAMLSAFSLAHAQTQDSALARVDQKNIPKDESVTATRTSTGESDNTSKENESSYVKFVVPLNAMENDAKRSILNNKVGPNGEDLLLENDKYYYINGEGKKVKVKPSMLKNKAKHS